MREAYEQADRDFEAVEAKSEEFKDKANQHHFIVYIWENFVPEAKRKPDKPLKDSDRDKDMKFARWIVARVSAHIHPDKFINEPAKHYLHGKICVLVNKIVNRLKGLE